MGESVPKVSIIVPVYNVERYLEQCLSSIRAQTLGDLEIICVNDGSTDGSLEILRRHASEDQRIRLIDKPNAGYGHTINRGIECASGEYVGIVESDDFVEPRMFETLYERAKADDLDIVRANYWLFWSRPEVRNEPTSFCSSQLSGKVFDPRETVDPFFFPPALWSMLVRRSLISESGIGLLETPGASFQDTSFSFKLWALARRAELLPDLVLHYRQDNESSSINNKSKALIVCQEYAEIERFILEDVCDRSLMPLAQRRKYDAYVWNLGRIDPSLRLDFARRAAEEFAGASERGWLEGAPFSGTQWRALDVLMRRPEVFVARLDRGASPAYPVLASKALGFLRGRR